jgi:ATP-dependent DNA helicase RecG
MAPHAQTVDVVDAPQYLRVSAQRMGLNDPVEGLLIAPNRYEDYRHVIKDFDQIGASAASEPIVYQVTVKAKQSGAPSMRGYARRGSPPPKAGYKDATKLELLSPFARECFRLEIDVEDQNGRAAIQTFFGSVQQYRTVQAGDVLTLRGNAERFGSKLYFKSSAIAPKYLLGTIAPVYLGAQGKSVNSEDVHALISWIFSSVEITNEALRVACEQIREDCGGLEDEDILAICRNHDSCIDPQSLHQLLAHLHMPSESTEEGYAAIAIAEKICSLSLQCRALKQNARLSCDDAPIGLSVNGVRPDLVEQAHALIQQVESNRGYRLTKNQVQVIQDVCSRLQSDQPLNGLLSGEVGSGKTIAYAIPATVAHMNGSRVAIIAPTELLADQIARNIATEFGPAVSVERVMAGKSIKNQDAILVGTIGLNSVAKKCGYKPNLLILDEQHKLSTASRESMLHPFTHTLDVSATPIPRSLALSLYEGMDLFTLNEQPVVKNIKTALIDVKDRKVASAAIKNALERNKRVAIVYTLVDAQEGTPSASVDAPEKIKTTKDQALEEEVKRKSAIDSAALFEQNFPGRVSLLHGKMSSDQKVLALDEFRQGLKKLMVTTTIFETGIDVPEIEVLVIRDPQHLGQSQLHQLRGRLARSGGDGLCMLMVEDLNALA